MDRMTISSIFLGIFALYVPFIRKIPIASNKIYNNARKVIEHESSRLMEEKYLDNKNNKANGNDLLFKLINVNKALSIEEKLTNDELRDQVS